MPRPVVCVRRLLALLGLTAAFGCGGDELVLPSEGEPAAMEIVSGADQSGRVGRALADPLVVRVTDSQGRPVVGAGVTFALLDGIEGAELDPASTNTSQSGEAAAELTLGTRVGVQRVEARVTTTTPGLDLSATFQATALPASASGIALVSGDDQSTAAGAALPALLVVRVTDAFGNPIPDVRIDWTAVGGGSVSSATTTTGPDGRTSVRRTLGPTAGAQQTRASSGGLAGSPVTFNHTATAGNAAGVEIVSGDQQTAAAGAQLPADLVVQVVDGSGNGVGGSAVSWVVTGGGGQLAPTSSTTDAQGRASTKWTLGAAGANTADAVVSGVGSARFTATATPAPGATAAAIAKNGGDGQSAIVGTPLPTPVSVKITSSAGAPVAGVTVTWAATGGGSVSSSTSISDGDGIAEVVRVLGATPGTYGTTATVAGLTGSPVTFTATATSGAPPVLVLATPPAATATSGAPLAPQPVVQIQNAQGQNLATAGVTVTAAIATGGGTLGGTTTRTTDATGKATFTDLAITGAAGPYTLIFAANGYTAATSGTITLAAGAPSGTGSSLSASPATIAAGATSQVTATVRDASDNPVAGAAVSLAATGSGNSIAPETATTDASGVARFTFGSSVAETKTLTATAAGVAIAQSATVTVTQVATSVTITSDAPEPSDVGQPVLVRFTVTAAAGTPDGDVTVTASGGDESCSATVAQGECSITLTAAGNRTLTATYAGNGPFAGGSDQEPHEVRAPNAAPTADDDAYDAVDGGTLSVPAPGVLEGDQDPEGGALTAVLESPPSSGTLTLNPDGSFTFTPAGTGTVTFTYRASDGTLQSAPATVTITIS